MLKTARSPDPPALKGSLEVGRTPGKGTQTQGQPLFKEQLSRQLFSQVKLQMEEEDRGLQSYKCHNAGSHCLCHMGATSHQRKESSREETGGGSSYTTRSRPADKLRSWAKAVEAAIRSRGAAERSDKDLEQKEAEGEGAVCLF